MVEIPTAERRGAQPRSAGARKRSGGRKKKPSTRCERLIVTCYPDDLRDLQALASAWGLPMSTLCWSVIHEWLQRGRAAQAELGEERGRLRLLVEMALSDAELGPWLRRQISD